MRHKLNYHLLLAGLLERLLTNVDIIVQTEVQVMSNPPRADILLLRRQENAWTPEQRAWLPDGIRDSIAAHILVDFKATESLTVEGLLRVSAYDLFYKQTQELSAASVLTVLLSAKQPQQRTLDKLSFVPTDQLGIYRNENLLAQHVWLISLNRLPNTSHNAFVKLFASQVRSRTAALEALQTLGLTALPTAVSQYIVGWAQHWLQGETMSQQTLTPEKVLEMGQEWYDIFLKLLPSEEILSRYQPEERLAGLQPEERLAGLQPEERLAGLQPEEVLSHYEPEERLAGLEPEEIEAYLAQLKKQKGSQE